MQLLLGNAAQRCHLSEFSRVVNNLFSFAGIGVTGKFEHFSTGAGSGPPAIAITGRTYSTKNDLSFFVFFCFF